MRHPPQAVSLAISTVALASSLAVGCWSVSVVDKALLDWTESRTSRGPTTTWKPWLSPTSEGLWWSNRIYADFCAMLTALGPGIAFVMGSRLWREGARASRGPGFAAVALGCVALAFHLIGTQLQLWFEPPGPGISTPRYGFWLNYAEWICPAVFGSWAWIILSGRWFFRPTWSEQLGRWYGWAWIALFFWSGMGWSILWG